MFKALIGDMFESDAKTLVNTVNCVGVMGKGVAQAFKKRYPKMFEDYTARCARGEMRLGEPYLYRELHGPSIINFPTKNHWRAASRYADVEQGLDYLVEHHQEWELESVAMPPLGCGNGGLDWELVGPLVYRKLAGLNIDVELYAPYGTPQSQLTEKFLAGSTQLSFADKGRSFSKMNPEWSVLMEVVRSLSEQPYASPVGRVIFQKISYVVTEMGVDTGFRFGKGSYGPFAGEVQDALHDFANRNWIREESLGRMMVLHVEPKYEEERDRFRETIQKHQLRIRKTVDLFSRIKNTQQAEDVFTVLYASRELKQGRRDPSIGESDLLKYILEWKKSWRTPGREEAVRTAIRQLVMLRWMDVKIAVADGSDD